MTAEGLLVSNEYIKQIIWAVSGLILMITVAAFDYTRVKDYSFLIYLGFLVLLVYTRLFGRVTNGAKSWIGIGDVGIQPSEFAKIAVILFLAQYLDNSEHEGPFRRLILSFVIVLVPIGLILSQPDFGTSLVFFPILVFMIVVAGLDWRYIIFILSIAFGTFALIVLPLWEKYILPSPTSFLFVFYQAPYVFYLLGVGALILALSTWGWNSYKKTYYFWIAYISLIFVGALVASALAHKVLKDYQIMRLIVFMDPSIDPRGSGWNILQSITAIGFRGFLREGFPPGNPEPLSLPPPAVYGFHLLDHRRGMGLRRGLRRLCPVLRYPPTLRGPSAESAGPLRNLHRRRDHGHDFLPLPGKCGHGHGHHAHHGHTLVLPLLRRVLAVGHPQRDRNPPRDIRTKVQGLKHLSRIFPLEDPGRRPPFRGKARPLPGRRVWIPLRRSPRLGPGHGPVLPDLYEIGMSNNAIRILYNEINSRPGLRCERVFAPAPDFEALLKTRDIPLYTLEGGIPLCDLDILGLTLGYELAATSILAILERGKIPRRRADRGGEDPLVIAGGAGYQQPPSLRQLPGRLLHRRGRGFLLRSPRGPEGHQSQRRRQG